MDFYEYLLELKTRDAMLRQSQTGISGQNDGLGLGVTLEPEQPQSPWAAYFSHPAVMDKVVEVSSGLISGVTNWLKSKAKKKGD